MGPIEIGLGIFVIPILVVVGKLLHAADELAEAIHGASVTGGSAGSLVAVPSHGEPRDDPACRASVDGTGSSAPATIGQMFGKRLPT